MGGIGLIELPWRREIVASHTVLYKRQQESNIHQSHPSVFIE
jgi:hypothetical protein